MNGTRASVTELATQLSTKAVPSAAMAVCAPAIYLAVIEPILASSSVAIGGQDVSEFPSGAYTGETAASMLKGHRLSVCDCGPLRTSQLVW